MAAQITGERGDRGAAQGTLIRIGVSIFLSINVMMFTMALWSQDVYGDAVESASLAASLDDLFRYLCLVLSLPVLFLLGFPLWEQASRRGLGGFASTDALILLGVSASFVYSAVSVVRGAGHVYFEVGCAVLVMVTLGRWLEATGKLQAGEALDALAKLLPDEVRLQTEAGESQTPLARIVVGDRLRILAGERVPVDALVVRGTAAVDRQLLAGESAPLVCEPGDRLLAGGMNLDGELIVEAVSSPEQGALARVVQMVRDARATKGNYQRLAERVARGFLPAVISIALATAIWHYCQTGIEPALMASLAVLLIACPCALGLATPMAVSAAIGTAARRQVLFRSGEALEQLAAVRAIRFDKTGTLTTGEARVVECVVIAADQVECVQRYALLLTRTSTHHFARAIGAWCQDARPEQRLPVETIEATQHQAFAGRGIQGTLTATQQTIYLGSLRWMTELQMGVPAPLPSKIARAVAAGDSLSALAWDGRVQALFVMQEELRPAAKEAVKECQRLGLDVGVLTGDHAPRGAALARELETEVLADQLPEDKVANLQLAREKLGPVAMVGDGVNDAPALAAADLGIALGCGADVSRESAAVCLLGNDPAQVAWATGLARRTVRVIRWNLAWAFAYNTIGVALAACGWLNPAWAAVAMVLSSALVVANCLRLRGAEASSARRRIVPSGSLPGAWPDLLDSSRTPLEVG